MLFAIFSFYSSCHSVGSNEMEMEKESQWACVLLGDLSVY